MQALNLCYTQYQIPGGKMNAREYILTKQQIWAKSNNIPLIGSKGERGRKVYTTNLDHNLLEPLTIQTHQCFQAGDGNELSGNPAKMQALHSSSAIAVNVFQYWQTINQVPAIASACKLCNPGNQTSQEIIFEEKFPIHESFTTAPNIDVVIHNQPDNNIKVFAIECKFSEAYSVRNDNHGLKEKYLQIDEIWNGIPALHTFAKSISPDDTAYHHLHPAQLVKHILGLKTKFGKNGFRLLYLWYDVPNDEGYQHRQEIKQFSVMCKQDGILFHTFSYQGLIMRLVKTYESEHQEYLYFIGNRYL